MVGESYGALHGQLGEADLCPKGRRFKYTRRQIPLRCTEHGAVPTQRLRFVQWSDVSDPRGYVKSYIFVAGTTTYSNKNSIFLTFKQTKEK